MGAFVGSLEGAAVGSSVDLGGRVSVGSHVGTQLISNE